MFDLQHVCKYYRQGSRLEVRALSDVTLSIPPQSFSALVGPSGSGKTTLLALLGALERPTSGRVLWDGKDFGTCSDVELARIRRRMGFVFQNYSLLPRIPAWENITYPLIPQGVSRDARYELARELLERVGLGGRLMARPDELSGGEQQRVAFARAVAGRPQVLLADEPTAQLDAVSAAAVMDLLLEAHAAGTSVIVSSHDRSLVDRASHVFELRAGCLEGTIQRSLADDVTHRGDVTGEPKTDSPS